MIVGIILAFLVAAVAILIMAVAYLFEITDSLESSVNICSGAVRKEQDYIGIIFDRIIAIEKRELERKKDEYGVLSKSSKSYDEQTGEETD